MSAHTAELKQANQAVAEKLPTAKTVYQDHQPLTLPAIGISARFSNVPILAKLQPMTDGVQAKLLSPAHVDAYEQEADQLAAEILENQNPATPVRVQPYAIRHDTSTSHLPTVARDVLNKTGQPLPPAVRQDMERRFGHDLSSVRVHTGNEAQLSARALKAKAYTVGHNIVFGSGQFSPASRDGRLLLAHELTHVLQQSMVSGQTGGFNMRPLVVQRRADPGSNSSNSEAAPASVTVKEPDKPKIAAKAGQNPGKISVVTDKTDQGAAASKAGTTDTGKTGASKAHDAIAPATDALADRAANASRHPDPNQPVDSAQAAAITPVTEQTRSAATQTLSDLDGTKTEKVQINSFKAALKKAIADATPQPSSQEEAERVMKGGGKEASKTLGGQLAPQRDAAAGSLKAAAGNEVSAASQSAPPKTALQTEKPGTPPVPVPANAANSVAPTPLPDQRLDYSADRHPTEQLMKDSNVTSSQMQEGKDPAFGPALDARSSAEQHEAAVKPAYRESETALIDKGKTDAQNSLAEGLQDVHDQRLKKFDNVAKQQVETKDKNAAERERITHEITAIKDKTRTDVETILNDMDTQATKVFEAGLQSAETVYARAFDDAKGGVIDWLTLWGSDWDKHIAAALTTARGAYLYEVDKAIDQVAELVDSKLTDAKKRVADGRKQIDDYVSSLNSDVKQFGVNAAEAVKGDFDTMTSDINQRRDSLINKLTEQYQASYDRMSAMESKFRDENKSLWQKVYDATVGAVKQILEFKAMLLGMLGKAADVIGDIIEHPIRFLGNLVSGVMQGLKNFMGKIGIYLQKGLMDWLFGALSGAGLQLPDKFDLQGIVSIVLQILGLTYANFRARAVKIVGEPVVAGMEKAAEIFLIIKNEGIKGLWRFIKEKLTDLKSMVLDAILDFVKERVIIAGVTWIIGLLNPASAFFKACKAIYDIIVFFVTRGQQIMALVNAVLNSLGAIAKGAIGVAAGFVENALAKAIPVAIGFLAGLLGLGDPSKPVRALIDKAQAPVNKAIDWVINLAVKAVKALGGLLAKGGKKAVGFVKGLFADIRESFSDADDQSHSLYFSGDDSSAELMIASTPRLAHDIMNDIAAANDKNRAAINAIKTNIDKVRNLKLKITSLTDEKANKQVIAQIKKLLAQIAIQFKKVTMGKPKKMAMTTISFEKIYVGMDKEYRQQLNEQQTALRAMTISRWMTNRFIFEKKGRIDDGTLRQQMNAKNEKYEDYKNRQLAKGMKQAQIDEQWQYQKAATHRLDQVAGGDHYDFANVGQSQVNSHIGGQWRAKVSELTEAVEKVDPSVYGSVKMNVTLQ